MSHSKDSLLEHFQQGVGSLHVVHLVDLLPPMHVPEDWYVKFCEKMRTRKLVGFSNKFHNVHTIESIHVGSRPSDVAISRRCNCILVCFPLMVLKVLNSANGEILHIIKTIEGSSDIFKPVALAFNSLNQLLLLESPPRFEIVYEEDHSKWKSKAQLDTRMMQNPKGIIYEENSRQILVCDKRNFRLLVFTEDGKYVCSYESTQGGFVPEGLCYDDHTGELYVASSLDCRVLIFK